MPEKCQNARNNCKQVQRLCARKKLSASTSLFFLAFFIILLRAVHSLKSGGVACYARRLSRPS